MPWVPPRFHEAEAINQVASLLTQEEVERHHNVVFAIDDPRLLSPEQLEELRRLANTEMDSASPFALTGMDLAESVDHLRYHLAPVGRTGPVVADDAAARLHRYANGLPRALNNTTLMAADAGTNGLVDDACTTKAVAEFTRN